MVIARFIITVNAGSSGGAITMNCPADVSFPVGTPITWTIPTATTTCSSGGNCNISTPSGFSYLGQHLNSKYYLSNNSNSWSNARTSCQNTFTGGDLASLSASGEQDFILGIPNIGNDQPFVGLSDQTNENDFRWVNGDDYPDTPTMTEDSPTNNFAHIGSGNWGNPYVAASGGVWKKYICELPCSGGNNSTTITQVGGPLIGSTPTAGTYIIEYQATDNCGNSTTCSFVLNVTSGTPSCNDINVTTGTNQINITGLTAPIEIMKVFDTDNGWNIVFQCDGSNCGSSKTVSNLPSGNYRVNVIMYTATWSQICEKNFDVSVSGSFRIAPDNVLDLSANATQKTVQLEWIATQTDETESFIIEKSIDGIHFKPIKVVAENLEDSYFKNQDENPDFGTNYYRIKQQFISGEIRYSPIRKETFYLDENTISLYPNPAKEELWVNLGELSNVGGNISIYNMLGQKVSQKVLKDREKQLRFNVADYQNGLYYLTIKAKGNRAITKRFVVENWR